jgi:hypothetical protein
VFHFCLDNGNSQKKSEEEVEEQTSAPASGGQSAVQSPGTGKKGKKKKDKSEGKVLFQKDKVSG